MEPVKLLERAASGAAHAVRHPIASAAYAAGIVRGVAEVAKHAATGHGHEGHRPTSGLRAVPGQEREPMPPAPQREPGPPGESFSTEPKATSRTSEHGGPGNDAEIDDWMAVAGDEPDLDVEMPVHTTGAGEADLQQPGTEPLLDSGTAKAVRSESEMLRKDAERDPE